MNTETQEEPEVQKEGYSSAQEDLSDAAKKALKGLLLTLYNECRSVRESQMPIWRRNYAFWKGIQTAIYLSVARDYTTINDLRQIPGLENLTNDEERVINVMRAHGEAIIAALSANVPYAQFSPENAEDPDDISTAKAFRKSADLIEIQNEAAIKITKALYHLYLYGVAFSYNIYNKDKKYGIIREPQIGYETKLVPTSICQDCGSDIAQNEPGAPQQQMMGGALSCPQCGSQNIAEEQVEQQIPYIHAVDETPKGRTLIDVYGPLHVTVPHFVRNLDQCGYLRLDTDLDHALVQELYPDLKFPGTGQESVINREERADPSQLFYENKHLDTVTRLWVRDWQLNRIDDEECKKEIRSKCKDGAYVVFVNDEFAEYCNENLDDCWTVTLSPVSEYIHADPLCNPVIPIQIMLNDLIELTMETIETGVPINFADPAVVDFKKLNDRQSQPGDFVPVKAARNGASLDSAFHSVKPSILSQEVGPFREYLDSAGQLVLGAFPSIFGGNQQTGSKTLGEYKESRENALQRLSLPWKSIASWWMHTIHKAVLIFINNMIEDEHFAKKVGGGNYINVWIRKAELNGKIGNVYVENSDQLPVSYNQVRQFILDLMGQKNQAVDAVLYHPENFGFMQRIFGAQELYIPGDDDRNKQLRQIQELLQGQPDMGMADPLTGQSGQMTPSIAPDPFDNHQVCIEVLSAWLKSDIGQEIKTQNPMGYQNVVAQFNARQMMLQPQAPAPGNETEQVEEPTNAS